MLQKREPGSMLDQKKLTPKGVAIPGAPDDPQSQRSIRSQIREMKKTGISKKGTLSDSIFDEFKDLDGDSSDSSNDL